MSGIAPRIDLDNPRRPREFLVSHRATASFIVETFDVVGQPDAPAGETVLSSAVLSKVFSGDVEGTSTVQMLSAQTPVEGSAAYVALERISASVHGRKGTFVLLHAATYTDARWTVVADSGTGELAGITGAA